MTTISKELKYASFEYAEETKMFSISDPNGNKIELNKVYAFAFMRFVIRMAQRNWLRTKPPQKDDPKPLTPQDIGPNWREAQLERMACEGLLAEIEEDADHPDQTHFSYES
jgi:hypothetical protein